VPRLLGGLGWRSAPRVSRRQAVVRAAVWACYVIPGPGRACLAGAAGRVAHARLRQSVRVRAHVPLASVAYTVSAFWRERRLPFCSGRFSFRSFTVVAVRGCRREDPLSLPTCGYPPGRRVLLLVASRCDCRPRIRSSPLSGSTGDGYGLNRCCRTRAWSSIRSPCMWATWGLAIPFALRDGRTARGRGSLAWGRSARRWTLIAWAVLDHRQRRRAWWAYVTLGWEATGPGTPWRTLPSCRGSPARRWFTRW